VNKVYGYVHNILIPPRAVEASGCVLTRKAKHSKKKIFLHFEKNLNFGKCLVEEELEENSKVYVVFDVEEAIYEVNDVNDVNLDDTEVFVNNVVFRFKSIKEGKVKFSNLMQNVFVLILKSESYRKVRSKLMQEILSLKSYSGNGKLVNVLRNLKSFKNNYQQLSLLLSLHLQLHPCLELRLFNEVSKTCFKVPKIKYITKTKIILGVTNNVLLYDSVRHCSPQIRLNKLGIVKHSQDLRYVVNLLLLLQTLLQTLEECLCVVIGIRLEYRFNSLYIHILSVIRQILSSRNFESINSIKYKLFNIIITCVKLRHKKTFREVYRYGSEGDVLKIKRIERLKASKSCMLSLASRVSLVEVKCSCRNKILRKHHSNSNLFLFHIQSCQHQKQLSSQVMFTSRMLMRATLNGQELQRCWRPHDRLRQRQRRQQQQQ